ncbi:MAG: hypothetical protein LKE61_11305 [Erysipelotrichaceae bacterium]|jgi:hypothetical protein|nr:hypothetical protein [Erysipelotrichaceae bacterium]MCI1364225.1 hypothetical protein [Solobacterium sp.]MCH4043547.1 hypothetical protein [Erysipelotrichaceae bacterium]MCH4120767.1 hypothetical protein [Erysipelotrichaceae bacterium]MCI1418637.1 hypothetical protein [Solobacterium sp.]
MKNKKENKTKYDMQYQRDNMKNYGIWLNRKKDSDLILWLSMNHGGTTASYIKQCLKNEMEHTLASDPNLRSAFEKKKSDQIPDD